jgi:flagellar hook-associated protein 2
MISSASSSTPRPLAGKTDGINATIRICRSRGLLTLRLQGIRARYTAQYNAMDALVAKLNSTSSYLTSKSPRCRM